MPDNLSLTIRVIVIGLAVSSSVVTATVLGPWAFALAAFLLVVAMASYLQQQRRPSQWLECLLLGAGFHGTGTLLLAFALVQKQLTLRGHQTVASFVDISIGAAVVLLAWHSYSHRHNEPTTSTNGSRKGSGSDKVGSE